MLGEKLHQAVCEAGYKQANIKSGNAMPAWRFQEVPFAL